MQGAVESIVDGLFSALVTLGTVPIIKCPKVRQALAATCELFFCVLVLSVMLHISATALKQASAAYMLQRAWLGCLRAPHRLPQTMHFYKMQYGSLCTAMQAHG